MVRSAIPWTLGLVGITTILAFALGTVIGIVAAWRRGAGETASLPPVLVVASAIPYFWVGMMFILVFGLKLQWLPGQAATEHHDTPSLDALLPRDVLEHACCPASRC